MTPRPDSDIRPRDGVDDLIGVLKQVDVPEPSPLFWDHLSARVRDAVAHEEAGTMRLPSSWRDRFRVGWVAGAVTFAMIAIVAVAVSVRQTPRENSGAAAPVVAAVTASPSGTTAESAPVGTPARADAAAADVIDSDPSLAVIADLTSQMDWDDAAVAGLVVRPGTVDGALSQLSEDEQHAVVEILQQEIKQSKPL